MTPGSGPVMDPRTSLAVWLRDGRARKKLSLDDVARITKIQPRILERLESGQLDGLPAEVFVKGFVRSFARCVGLDETEALERFVACRGQAPVAQALIDSMSELAPVVARTTRPMDVVEPEIIELGPILSEISILPPPVEVSATELPIVDISLSDLPVIDTSSPELPIVEAGSVEPAKKKRTRKKAASIEGAPGEDKPKRTRSRKKKVALGTPAEPTPVVAAPAEESAAIASVSSPAHAMELEVAAVVEAADSTAETTVAQEATVDTTVAQEATVDTTVTAEGTGPTHGTWRPTMPPLAATPSVPWRRPALPATTLPVTPSLVIDDADPDRAEREQEERAASREPHRVSFLPPILLDREDRSARQGGLTLAVIILLIAATLTLSYLMRRPSVSGDGVTMRDVPASLA